MAEAPASGIDETEIDIRGILSLLRRRIRLILIIFAAVMGVAMVALVAMTPIYSASTLIFVDPSRKNLLDADATGAASSSDNARVESEVEILRSEAVLLSVILSENLVSDSEFGVRLGMMSQLRSFFGLGGGELPSGQQALQSVLSKFRSAVSVQRRGLTYLITLTVSSEDPDKAARLANALADSYIQDQLRSKIEGILASQRIISARLAQASQVLIDTEEAFDTFIGANIERLRGVEGFGDISTLESQLSQLNAERDRMQTIAQSLDQSLARQNWSLIVDTLQSEAAQALDQQRQTLLGRIEQAATGSPAAIELRAELARIESQLQSEAQAELTELRTLIPGVQSELTSLRQNLRSSVMSSDLPVEMLTQLYELRQSAELARLQHQNLLARNSELHVQADLQIADSRIASPALRPSGASSPNTRLILLLAGLGGLGLGIGIAFLYENYLGGFTSEAQIASVLKVPVLGDIPKFRPNADQPLHSIADVMQTSPLSAYSESIRRVRSGIDQVLRRLRKGDGRSGEGGDAKRGVVIMVTSTSPNEGKSTISLSLARAYSMSGKRTLLIDCDMRKPSIHRHLGIEQRAGLIDILRGTGRDTINPAQAIYSDRESELSFILGARSADIPTDQLIMGKNFQRLIEAAQKSFEVVVIDTPPVGPVVDAAHIAHFADVIVFVARWSATSQSEARGAVSRLADSTDGDVPILAVLNQQEGFGSRYYYKRYSGYYAEA